MAEIGSLLSSPGFWFTSFVFAVVVNLVSAYFKTWVDRQKAKLSAQWRKRVLESDERLNRWIHQLRTDESMVAFARHMENRARLSCIAATQIGLAFLAYGLWLIRDPGYVALDPSGVFAMFAIGVVAAAYATHQWFEAGKLALQLDMVLMFRKTGVPSAESAP